MTGKPSIVGQLTELSIENDSKEGFDIHGQIDKDIYDNDSDHREESKGLLMDYKMWGILCPLQERY